MNKGKRTKLMVGLTIGFVAILGALFSDRVLTAQAHIEGWVITAPVSRGATLTRKDVQQIQVPVSGDHFSVLAADPVGQKVAMSLQPGDLLTQSLLDPPTMAEVPLSVHMAPALSSGESVDIYAIVGGESVLLAKHMVIAGTNPLTILVPNSEEPLWVAVAGSGSATPLIMASSSGIGVPSTNTSVLQAIQQLDSGVGGNATKALAGASAGSAGSGG
ncbi:MAG: hypothetical protein ACYCZN_01980 [Candidatus Dormibacteria bacterium]